MVKNSSGRMVKDPTDINDVWVGFIFPYEFLNSVFGLVKMIKTEEKLWIFHGGISLVVS